ncbi:YbaB/EbfC family nucleoid-associated protein [Catellatospora sp. KI3]|uniref:YbaB/EbfC family nucleoid-associated protein n=1 Tax=Catellatospora sp. KI3 TaxID=3041620 RepID=UPI0024822462|nr:YbaB/EbfC family nucleoid-associated protein [Catellatospora sp. KI3]MDI1460616.1 YbaB/EbfC family nucleoid-associated protein [Catellatospora sp. KI3]
MDVFGPDLDSVDQRVGDWQSMLEERARRAADLAAQTQDLAVEASVLRGLVTATVDQNGQLVALKLHERVRELPADRIASAVIEATRAARNALGEHVRQLSVEAGFGDEQ